MSAGTTREPGSYSGVPVWAAYTITAIAEVALSAGLVWLDSIFPLGKFPIPYVLLTMVIAYFFGGGPAFTAGIMGWAAFTFLFVPSGHHIWPATTSPEAWARETALLLGVTVVAIAAIQTKKSHRRIQRLADEATSLNVSLTAEIAERSQAEEALRESERRYSALFGNKINGMAHCRAITDEQGRPVDYLILQINEAYEQIIGIKKADIEGRRVTEVFPDIRNYAYDYIGVYGKVALEGGEITFEEFFEATQQYLSIYAYSPLPGEFTAIFTDITNRKQAEEALRESEERLRLAHQAARIGAFDWDIRTGVNIWTPELEIMYGLEVGQFGKTQTSWEELIYAEDRRAAVSLVEQTFATGDPMEGEWRVQWPDGSMHWIFGRFQAARDDGDPVRLTGVNIDITERKQAEEEIRKLNDELEQRVRERTAELVDMNRELEAFSYSVSHDLRAPLRAIDGFSNTLLKRYRDSLDEKGQDYLRRVRAAAQRMAILIDDILSLSRAGRAEIRLQRVDMSAMAREIISELRRSQPGRRVEIAIPQGLAVDADSHLMRSVLENLLGNAWKFTGNTTDPKIEFGSFEQDGERVYFVRDNGAGFDPAYVDKLFSPFQRLHTEDEFAGTGIGLALVQRILRRHGGRIWAEGAVDQGATFYFTIKEAVS